MEWKIVK